MPILSIIVPVYNVEEYLPVCLKSILSQSFCHYELLLIDDGSTDSSGKICDNLALDDSRIRVFHKKNEGVSIARNLGIEQSKGEWIYFVDSDDELTPECLKLLISRINDGADIIEGRYLQIGNNRPSLFPQFQEKEETYTKEEYLYRLFHYIPKQYHGYLWNKIFRADVIRKADLRFHTDIFFKEDGLFIMEYVCQMSRNVLYFQDLLYLYYKRDSGMMETYLRVITEKSITHLKAVNLMYETMLSRNPSFKTKCAAKDTICESYRKLKRGQVNSCIKGELNILLRKYVSKPYYMYYCLRLFKRKFL